MSQETGGHSESTELLVGRDRELELLASLLDGTKPALAVMSSEPGMGKTTLLRALRRQAALKGWRTSVENSGMDISRDCTPERFREALEKSFAIPAPGVGDASPSLYDELSRLSPVLVMIDGYEPSAGFEDWFRNSFTAGLRALDAPVVFVVAGKPECEELFRSTADLLIKLGPLEPEIVRSELQAVAERLNPGVSGSELDAYVEAAVKSPEVLGSLVRLFKLADSPA